MKLNSNSINLQQFSNISIVQFSTDFANSFNYIAGPDAIEKGMVTISEVSEGGSVQRLYAVNNSKEYVFFSDGDVLVGAKQNRVLQVSILLEPESKTIIPVNCVEQGRWSYRTRNFNSADFVLTPKFRKRKLDLVYDDEWPLIQREVWNYVRDLSNISRTDSATDDFVEIGKKIIRDKDDVINSFKCDKDANGVAMFLNKELNQIEMYNRKEIYCRYFKKLINSFIIDAFNFIKKAQEKVEMDFERELNNILESISKIEKDITTTAGAGNFYTFRNVYTGAELIFNEHLIHRVAFLNKRQAQNRNRFIDSDSLEELF